ncbi:MAG: hypothetical protein K940chlam7_00258 [Chlamydiae bacterium]|nr:hypothetical protein [Chlamydiota bacterium]
MSNVTNQTKSTHFKGKEAIGHVAETQAKGILNSSETHGTEIPGHISSGADAAREMSIALLVIWVILSKTTLSFPSLFAVIGIFSLSWMVWKSGRSAWLAWFRLERMHRVVEQERWEIKHQRKQEREELKVLYGAKGFEGKLLDDVVDVLMADEDRLLRVMVEEELCLSLGTYEHPLKQAVGAAIGSLVTAGICIFCLYFFPFYGLWFGSFFTLGTAAAIAAHFEGNQLIPAVIWNFGLGALTCSLAYFLFDYIHYPLWK